MINDQERKKERKERKEGKGKRSGEAKEETRKYFCLFWSENIKRREDNGYDSFPFNSF